jgi:hypothetical protein
MKFVMLIYQGTAPLPGSEAWKALSEAEQKAIYADYASINKSPGVTPGLPLARAHRRRSRCRVDDGRPSSVGVLVHDRARQNQRHRPHHGSGPPRRARREDRLAPAPGARDPLLRLSVGAQ